MARQRVDEPVATARTKTGRTRFGWMAIGRMGISAQLIMVLVIPLTALLAITGYGVNYGAGQAGAATELATRTEVGISAYALIDDLQVERSSLVGTDSTNESMRAEVESSVAALRAAAVKVGGDLAERTEAALSRVDAASRIAERDLGGTVALSVYSSAIDDLLDVATVAIDPRGEIDDAASTTTDYLARAQAAASEERDLVTVLADRGSLDAASFQEVMALASAQQSYISLAASAAPADKAVLIKQVGFASSAADILRRETFAGDDDRTEAWVDGLTDRTNELAVFRGAAEERMVATVATLARDSRVLFVAAALSAIAIGLVSILLLRRAVHSIARPLQDLSSQAEDVARTRLPEAVVAQQREGSDPVHLPSLRATGAAEVHDVARAFNEVQDTALRLASEQAALRRNQAEALTNLGRRNQTLLARQLDFISSLEVRETDPAFLDHLFKLDHLASRMRRNAESLLILSGSETPRRRRSPAPIHEVVRAAMSEVDEFERVRIGNLREATVTGPVVIDLVHLLAELIENALAFSPPDTTVEIDGRPIQGGYQFAVIDHGVGMSDVELVAANHRLAGDDELSGMPTRYLGQYVVARLGVKTGSQVRLQPSAGGRGVTAMVILASSALIGDTDRESVARPLPGSKAARAQGPVPFAPGSAVELDGETFAQPVLGHVLEPSVDPTVEKATGPDPDPVVAPPLEPAIEVPADATADPVVGPVGVGPGPDPWAEFRMEERKPETAPPPAPIAVPVQPDWTPSPMGETADTVSVGRDEPQPVPEKRLGGLARRVPGASLAESRSGDVGTTVVPDQARSADGVRSMLSSLQAGRSRGRTDDVAAPETSDLETSATPISETQVGTTPISETQMNDPDAAAASEDSYSVEGGGSRK